MTTAKVKANEAFARHAQARLAALGHYRGTQDGWAGAQTQAAFDAALDPPVPPVQPVARVPARVESPFQRDVPLAFGPAAGPDATAGRCTLPFPFVIAWDTSQRITRFSCHLRVADALTSIFAEAARHYGQSEFERLRLHYFGGCFADRAMRGSSATSMHSWGIAVDLDPERNQLSWRDDRAAFARPEYLPFWTIVKAHGAISLGRTRNFDWMHFQFAKL